jgi:CRISPR-associated protein (TIGR02710 family)
LQLKRIVANQEMYGVDRTAIDRARRFRIEQVLPLVVRRIRENWVQQTKDPVDLLVSLSGHSPETTVVAFEMLLPDRLLVLQSEAASQSIDVVAEHASVRPSRIKPCLVDPNDPLAIYALVKDEVDRFRRSTGRQANVVIDITGGKKIMSAAAALAATQLDLQMCYIDGGRYDSSLRQPVPGTEKLILLPNPTEIFREREMDKASTLLAQGDFLASYLRFGEIAEKTDRSSQAQFGRDLAHCYAAWCNFDFASFGSRIRVLRERIEDPRYRPRREILDRIYKQVEFLEALADEPEGIELTLNYFLIACHYRRRDQHDFAVLLYYRTLEHLLSRQLEQRAEGFKCKSPKWSLLSADVDDLEMRFRKTGARIYRSSNVKLPNRVGLMDAALLLHSLEDPVLRTVGLADDDGLFALMRQAEFRNRSVLAHGSESVDAHASGQFEGYVRDRLLGFWSLQEDRPKLDSYLDALRFVEHI